MTLIANSFLKIIPIALTSDEVTAGLATKTYTNTRVEDLDTIAVYYNGQLIPRVTGPALPDSKYYYTVASTPAPASVTLTDPAPPTDTSSIEFELVVNTAYKAAGYNVASPASTVALNLSDTFTITYYYVVYSAV